LRYKRKEPCSVCGQDYFIDEQSLVGWCGCGIVKIRKVPEYVLKTEFQVWNVRVPDQAGSSTPQKL
jgi:hypothetical protein